VFYLLDKEREMERREEKKINIVVFYSLDNGGERRKNIVVFFYSLDNFLVWLNLFFYPGCFDFPV